MKWVNDLLKSIPDSALNAIGLLSGIITISSLIPILFKMIGMITKGTFSIAVFSNIHIAFILLLLFCIWLLYKTFKYRKIQAETRELFSQSYYDLLRNYRNTMGEIEVAQKKSEDSLRLMKDFIRLTLNVLCDVFYTLSRQKVSSCIKIIEPGEDLDYINARVVTFCRSSNSDSERQAYDERNRDRNTLICDNTDFNNIVEPGKSKSCFYCSDLIAYQKKIKKLGDRYNNTNTEWADYYRATIVVPIRIANQRNPNNDLNTSYTILGFLCVDSMSTHAFEESQKAFYTAIVKGFAALLYSILDIYKRKISPST